MNKNTLLLLICLFLALPIISSAEVTRTCNAIKIVVWQRNSSIDYGRYVPDEDALPDEINEPRVLVVDSKENIYVADPVNYRVLKFDNQGKLLLKFSLQKREFAKRSSGDIIPDMTLDKHENLYVINLFEYRVEVYNSEGKFIKLINYFNDNLAKEEGIRVGPNGINFEPEHIGVDEDGTVYIYRDAHGEKTAFGGVYSAEGKLTRRNIQFAEFGGTKKDFEKRIVGFSGYYLYILKRNTSVKIGNNVIVVLNNAAGKELGKCSINIEPTTKTYINRNGEVYFFEFNTLNVMKAKMIQ